MLSSSGSRFVFFCAVASILLMLLGCTSGGAPDPDWKAVAVKCKNDLDDFAKQTSTWHDNLLSCWEQIRRMPDADQDEGLLEEALKSATFARDNCESSLQATLKSCAKKSKSH